MAKVQTRLEAHKKKFENQTEFPPRRLEHRELSTDEQKILHTAFLQKVKENPDLTLEQSLASTYADWGVMCPHPMKTREQLGISFKCGACGCYSVENERFRRAG
jgi:hypothetical protein